MTYSGTPAAFIVADVTTYTSYGGTYTQVGAAGTSPNVSTWNSTLPTWERAIWIALRKSGTNYYGSFSFDGEVYSPESVARVWAGTVDRIGMLHGPIGAGTSGVGTGSVTDIDWFNRLA